MKKLSLLVAAALMVPVAHAHQAGDILVRGGAMAVSPTTDSGDTFNVDSNTQLGLTLSYMLTDNWAVELLAATPFSHSVSKRRAG
jgi:outer membrane protein